MTPPSATRRLGRTTAAIVISLAVVSASAASASAEVEPVEPTATLTELAGDPVSEPTATPEPTTPPTTAPPTPPATTPPPIPPGLQPPTIPASEKAVTLKSSVTSARVVTLQQALDINMTKDYFAGAAAGPYTSVFTSATTSALKAWQSANGYPATGTITTQSAEWKALMDQRGPIRKTVKTDLLKQGVSNASVRSLQAALALNTAGSQSTAFSKGVYESYFGPLLTTAVKKWQRAQGYEASGKIKVGSLQWNALMDTQQVPAVALKTPVKLKKGTTHASVATLQKYLDRNKSKDYQKYTDNVFDTFFGSSTKSGLKSLQTKLGYPADGVIEVGSMEWNHLKSQATKKQKGKAGAKLKSGTKSVAVTWLQEYLDSNKVKDYFSYSGGYTTTMGPATVSGLKSWQKKHGYPATGTITVNSIQWGHLKSQVVKRKLDRRCYTSGVVVCASKKDRKVYYVSKGKIVKTLDARFGGRAYDQQGKEKIYTTKEGSFTITRKVKNEVSYAYGNTPMPFTSYFYGGQGFHYSYGFAAQGWRGDWGSHGCINLRSWSGAEWLFNKVKVGTKVVVYK